jgi:hypothetical protein
MRSRAVLFLALLSGGMSVTSVSWAAPKLTQTLRVQTARASYGQPKLIRDAEGNPFLVELSEIPSDPKNLELAALDSTGATIAQVELSKPQGQNEFRSIESASFNSRGEIVAITMLYRDGNGVGELAATNLNRQISVQLAASEGAVVLDQISYGGRELLAVSQDLGEEGNLSPVSIHLVDADTGEIVRAAHLDYPISGKFGVDSAGSLKLLLFGYELFAVMDFASGQVDNLAPPRQQPSIYPVELDLSFGSFLQFDEGQGTTLYDLSSLFGSYLRPFRSYPKGTAFVGSPKPWAAVVPRTVNGQAVISIESIQTGDPIGVYSQNTYPGSSVAAIHESVGSTIAVISQAVDPDSYEPGTILTYLDLTSGQVLRTRTVPKDQLTTELVDVIPGELLAVERVNHFTEGSELEVVDLFSNSVISSSNQVFLIGPSFHTEQGTLLGLTGQDSSGVCVTELIQLSAQTCISDPLVRGAVEYGYAPFEVDTGRILLPLLGPANGLNYPSFGYVEFKVE